MRDHLTQTPPAIKRSQQQLECVKCGSQTHATCLCGMDYKPVLQRVVEYDKTNPGRSERQASADLGIPKTTVHDARQSGGRDRPPEVTGRDGKQYQATKPPREKTMTQQDEIMAKLELQIINAGYETIVVQLSAHEAIERLERARNNLKDMVDGFIPF